MKQSWISLALMGWLGWASLSPAQSYMPKPVGAARMLDPMPAAPSTVNDKYPPLVDGPMNAQIAPPGPPDSLSLPEDHTSAFMPFNCGADEGIYVHLGSMALQKQHLGQGYTAYYDRTGPPATNNPLELPPATGNAVQWFNQIGNPMRWGMRGTVGYFWNGQSVEATMWGVFQSSRAITAAIPSGIFSFFYNPPAGFDQGIWLEADRQTLSYTWSMFNTEINYRYASAAVLEMEILLGARYLNLRERLSVDTVNFGRGGPPLEEAMYSVGTRNNIYAPQIGVEWARNLKVVTIGVTGKAALGVNNATVDTSLTRGDGFLGFNNQRSETHWLSGIWEVNAWVDLIITEKMHIRGGYMAMWVTGVTVAVDQFDYNLANPAGRVNDNGSIFFHGPIMEFQFVF